MALLDTGTPGTSKEIYSEDAEKKDSNSQPLGYKLSALAIELNNSKAIAEKELSLSSWCVASLYIYSSFLNCGWINSTRSQQQLLSCLAQWLEHSVHN